MSTEPQSKGPVRGVGQGQLPDPGWGAMRVGHAFNAGIARWLREILQHSQQQAGVYPTARGHFAASDHQRPARIEGPLGRKRASGRQTGG
jgi:hypothetical protein